jgi:hypothetical protein
MNFDCDTCGAIPERKAVRENGRASSAPPHRFAEPGFSCCKSCRCSLQISIRERRLAFKCLVPKFFFLDDWPVQLARHSQPLPRRVRSARTKLGKTAQQLNEHAKPVSPDGTIAGDGPVRCRQCLKRLRVVSSLESECGRHHQVQGLVGRVLIVLGPLPARDEQLVSFVVSAQPRHEVGFFQFQRRLRGERFVVAAEDCKTPGQPNTR